ncbi:hypothetical protein NXW24_16080 [Bacteroides fragilis]|nr:hypothetical protein [Bacteroides fragilis]
MGLYKNEVNLELLSFPVISTYPVGYKKIYFRGGNFVYKDIKGYCASFLNLPFIKFFCDDLSAKIKKWYFSTSGKKMLVCLFFTGQFNESSFEDEKEIPGFTFVYNYS